ncbi:MAG: DUF433 domain-containing protein [Blastocatellales bacterium]
MDMQYVEYRDDAYWVADTRISLDSVVVAFQSGLSPETIASECFPSLTLEQVYGVIAYYLGHKAEIDKYLEDAEADFERLRKSLRASEPDFYQKMMEARRQLELAHQ